MSNAAAVLLGGSRDNPLWDSGVHWNRSVSAAVHWAFVWKLWIQTVFLPLTVGNIATLSVSYLWLSAAPQASFPPLSSLVLLTRPRRASSVTAGSERRGGVVWFTSLISVSAWLDEKISLDLSLLVLGRYFCGIPRSYCFSSWAPGAGQCSQSSLNPFVDIAVIYVMCVIPHLSAVDFEPISLEEALLEWSCCQWAWWTADHWMRCGLWDWTLVTVSETSADSMWYHRVNTGFRLLPHVSTH